MITTIKRKIDANALTGFVVNKSNNLTLIAIIYDFIFDGFVIIRNKDIKSEIVSESNKYYLKLMKREKLWHKIPDNIKRINLETWESALNDIKSEVIILEDEINETFLIGPIIDNNKTYTSIFFFNGLGEYKNIEKIKHSTITICKFMDRYSATHAKYLKWQK